MATSWDKEIWDKGVLVFKLSHAVSEKVSQPTLLVEAWLCQKAWQRCLGAETPCCRSFVHGSGCRAGWCAALHSCHFALAVLLTSAHFSFSLFISAFSKCYDSSYPVKPGSYEKNSHCYFNKRKGIISSIILKALLFSIQIPLFWSSAGHWQLAITGVHSY